MLILLPPSETKRPGGVGVSIDKAAIIWAALEPAREVLYSALGELCKNSDAAAKALGLGKKNLHEADLNLQLLTAPTMPALQRYTGVLYDALDFDGLSAEALRRADQQLFIQSALFGLLPSMQQIPNYRLSATSKIPGVRLKKLWTEAHAEVWPRLIGPVLDMRSRSYVELNPIPPDRESKFMEVLGQDGRALNHFNKKAKGAFVRAALENGLASFAEVPEAAAKAGLQAELTEQQVLLHVPEGY
ncbi:MAG: peroxide stress protein YaaA [Aquiluna sp.]